MRILKIFGFFLLIISLASCNLNPEPSIVTPEQPAPQSVPTESPAPSSHADILFVNGTILTMDDVNPTAQAIAVLGDKILAVGTREDILKFQGENTMLVDLEGHTLLPGFIDSHTHRITQRYKWDLSTVEEAAQEALSQGWTGLTELAVEESQFYDLLEAAERGDLKVKVNLYLTANTFFGEPLPEWYNDYQPGQQFGPYLRIAGLKVFIDGNSGRILYWEQDELNEFLRQRQAEGWQISMKAIGVESHELAISAYESISQGQAGGDFRHRIEHSLGVNDDQLSRMVQSQIIASIQPSFPGVIWYEPDIHALVNEQGMENMFRWREYQNAGVIMAASPYNPDGIHQEFILSSHISPIGLLHRSVTQVGLNNSPPQPWMLDKTLTVEEILPLLTIRGAYATFEDETKGSLIEGKFADLVILSENPLDVETEELPQIQVVMTMVGGNVEYCATGYKSLCPSGSEDTSLNTAPAPASNQQIIASSELPNEPAVNAFDGDIETPWGSGDFAEQWIQIDLSQTRAISSVRLTVAQYPAGETVHQIWGGESESSLQLLHEFMEHTSEYQVLEFTPSLPIENIRFILVVTVQSPSWVAWREIEIVGP